MKNKIVKILWVLPILFILFAFLGVHLTGDWAASNYDNWRLQQLSVLAILILGYVILYPKDFIRLSAKQYLSIIVWFILAILSVINSINPSLALLDFCWMLVLVSSGYILVKIKNHLSDKEVGKALVIIALAPLGIIIWIFVGYYLYWIYDLPLAWHGLFSNIRYYDDALLPCIFLLWYQPAFLKTYSKSVIVISAFYLLSLWLDAARANWLSIVVSLVAGFVIYRKNYKIFYTPLLSIIVSFLLYQCLVYLQPDTIGSTIIRKDTYVRSTMWFGSLETWLHHPIFGIGGGNFINLDNKINLEGVGHPHNLFLQFLVEWGCSGIMLILIVLQGYYQLILQANKIPGILFIGCIALLINSLLSGASIYPVSQIIMLIFFSLVISYSINNEGTEKRIANQIKFYPAWLGAGAVLVLLIMLRTSIFQYATIYEAIDSSGGPRFWLDAKQAFLAVKPYH